MKMRSSLFLALSLIVHAVCVTALALSHFRSVEAPAGNNVEMTVGENNSTGDENALTESNEAKPEKAPAIQPVEKTAEVVKPLPKKKSRTAEKDCKSGYDEADLFARERESR
jgi:hypothetical protein